jgi:hypothetical protein
MAGKVKAYRFLCGAGMDPSLVRGALPGASFVARAYMPGGGPGGADRWGILLDAPAVNLAGLESRDVVTDDGRRFQAWAETSPGGRAEEILAAARYWELPPAYVKTLEGFVEPEETR